MSASSWAKHPAELFALEPKRDARGRIRVSASLMRDVYALLDLEGGNAGRCVVGQAPIARRLGVTRQQVNEALAALVEVDLISVERAGKGRRYFIHHRGERAAIQLEHPLDGAENVSGYPDTSQRNVSGYPDTSGRAGGGNVSGYPDTLGRFVSGDPDTSAIDTSFRSREEEVNNRSGSSSSFDPDRDRSEFHKRLGSGPPCPEHDEPGKPSLDGSSRYYHELTTDQRRAAGKRYCTFAVEPAHAGRPEIGHQARTWEEVEAQLQRVRAATAEARDRALGGR